MKKNILIACTLLSGIFLTAFSYLNWDVNNDDVDFVYSVDSKFDATITKENLQKAKTVVDIVPKRAEWSKVSFMNMKVTVIQEDEDIFESGENGTLNKAQLALLKTADYSSSFFLYGKGKRKNGGPEGLKDNTENKFDFAYYLTVVPEKEAEYRPGHEALNAFLKNKGEKAIKGIIKKNKLAPGRLHFTISKSGAVKNISVDLTCGYSSVDEKMIELIKNTNGKWNPATNSKGEPVEQELFFFFGKKGC